MRRKVARATAAGTSTWRLDPAGSRGELATTHWFRGRREHVVSVHDGWLEVGAGDVAAFELHFRVVPRRAAAVDFSLHSRELVSVDAARFDAVCTMRVDRRAAVVTVRVHDLGPGAGPAPMVRRGAVLAGCFPFEMPGLRRLWRGPFAGREACLHLATVWLPPSGGPPEAA